MPATTTYLLDTNVISRIMKDGQGQHAQRYRARVLREPDCNVVTNIIVQCELLFGLARRPSPRLQAVYERQMEQLPVLPLEDGVSSHCAKLRTHLEQASTPMCANGTIAPCAGSPRGELAAGNPLS